MRTVIGIGVVIVLVLAGWLLLSNRSEVPDATGNYVLVDDGTGICRVGETEPIIVAAALPDSVPSGISRPKNLRFANRRFHFICPSPDQRFVAFACGEGDQWVGILDTERNAVRFVIFGLETAFHPGLWTPDSRYFSLCFQGSDNRLCVVTYEPNDPAQRIPKALNAWCQNGVGTEKFKPLSWQISGDTTFTFVVQSAQGIELRRVDLALRKVAEPTPSPGN